MNATPKTSQADGTEAFVAFLHRGADIAVNAAATYILKERAASRVNSETLTATLREETTAAIEGAIDDAREAIAFGMGSHVANATFAASMALAGIRAAKLALGEIA